MIKMSGFLVFESLIALMISFLAVMILSLVIANSKKFESEMEYKTDKAVAQHMIRKNKLNKVKLHDKTFYQGN